jgi:hypothetical protein
MKISQRKISKVISQCLSLINPRLSHVKYFGVSGLLMTLDVKLHMILHSRMDDSPWSDPLDRSPPLKFSLIYFSTPSPNMTVLSDYVYPRAFLVYAKILSGPVVSLINGKIWWQLIQTQINIYLSFKKARQTCATTWKRIRTKILSNGKKTEPTRKRKNDEGMDKQEEKQGMQT